MKQLTISCLRTCQRYRSSAAVYDTDAGWNALDWSAEGELYASASVLARYSLTLSNSAETFLLTPNQAVW